MAGRKRDTPFDEIDLEASGSGAAAEAIVNAMLTSGSTMLSSLESSLEMAATRNDGLSDKESKFKEAKSFVKAHRRTSSNPMKFPITARPHQICETSTESDNDQAGYC